MRSFITDDDGLTIQDFVAALTFLAWLTVSAYMTYVAVQGQLTEALVDFYGTFCMVPLTVVGGVFGVRAVNSYVKKSNKVGDINGQGDKPTI